MNEIYKKLLKIQQHVTKFTTDGSAQNYKYTTGTQVLNAIRPMMNELGLLLKQEVVNVENTRMDYTTASGRDKSEILSRVSMRFTWVDVETGETDGNDFAANGMNDWDKGFGSALTYAERYFLLKFFHVPTDEDDPDALKKEPAQPKHENDLPWLNPGTPEFEKVKSFIQQGGNMSDVRKKYKVSKAVEGQLK